MNGDQHPPHGGLPTQADLAAWKSEIREFFAQAEAELGAFASTGDVVGEPTEAAPAAAVSAGPPAGVPPSTDRLETLRQQLAQRLRDVQQR